MSLEGFSVRNSSPNRGLVSSGWYQQLSGWLNTVLGHPRPRPAPQGRSWAQVSAIVLIRGLRRYLGFTSPVSCVTGAAPRLGSLFCERSFPGTPTGPKPATLPSGARSELLVGRAGQRRGVRTSYGETQPWPQRVNPLLRNSVRR